MLASSGNVDIYTLQKLMGHKDPKVTQRYAHLIDAALHRGAPSDIIVDYELIAEGDKVATIWKSKVSGSNMNSVQVYRLENGKIAETWLTGWVDSEW